ncbi:C45 family autoproteolytic acyltransferase/hydrolase [Lysinibacillus sp. NPDC097195]|uniref:C45 family autoproteolytic acyltransferase/hydolase n=1 Tax=Lysinibacillus sp. NPDC097195 TaxID=3364141 RepID=UPI00381E56CF
MEKYDDIEVKVIALKGDAYLTGIQQSKEHLVSAHLAQQELLLTLTANCNTSQAQAILQDVCPNLLQEMQGLAHALHQPLDTIIKMYSGYNTSFPEMGCTSFVHGGKYIRNYDFSPSLYDARLVFSNPHAGYASVGFSQQLIGRLDGMNEKGLVVGLHFVNNAWQGDGFLASTIVRILLDQCKNIDEAVNLLSKLPHRYCYNFSITDASGKVVVVEATPTEQVVDQGKPFICTNHFESQQLQPKNRAYINNSLQRKRFINNTVKDTWTTESVYHLFNNGKTPLFVKQYNEYFGTLHTVIYAPSNLQVIVGIGQNCMPLSFSLQQYIEGNLILPKTIKGKILQTI